MKKVLAILIALTVLILTVSCGETPVETTAAGTKTYHYNESASEDVNLGISLTINSFRDGKFSLTSKQNGTEVSGRLMFNLGYDIEEMDDDGYWVEMYPLNEKPAEDEEIILGGRNHENDVYIKVTGGMEWTDDINVTEDYGELEPGFYRITKRFIHIFGDTSKTIILACDFTIDME